MASKVYRPLRRLLVFAIVVLVMYGGVAAIGRWAPKLGLDLQGGTRITLQASTATGQAVTPEKLAQARSIIDARVNGSGVAEASVTTQGSNNIVVEIPGQNRQDLVNTVKQTAQLRFRLVAMAAAGLPAPQPSVSPTTSPTASASSTPTTSPSPSPTASPSGAGRAVSRGLMAADKAGSKPKVKASSTAKPTASASPTAAPTPQSPTLPPLGDSTRTQELLKWQTSPDPGWVAAFQSFQCPTDKSAPPVTDNPDTPLLTCDDNGTKYLLSAALIEGTQLTNATAGIPQNQIAWVVTLSLNSDATSVFRDVTQAIVGTQKQFAIVLDGKVIEAPVVSGVIPNGQAEISGNFNQQSATSLANSLKYGALPLRFDVPVVTEEGPTLAADQLRAGLTAGAFGLALVMIYCLFYYRGLGIVVIASLVVAAAVTYAAVLLLSESAGFTLTLPGIAGLIVAVGITADSFIVYFERIRDEMRDGKSVRVAVEAAWVRARATCVAADTVSILAAVILYIFAIGVVKGFAFALGISTLIDLVVFFHFTKPFVSWLGSLKFFNSGSKLSGLSPDHLGIDRIGVAGSTGAAR